MLHPTLDQKGHLWPTETTHDQLYFRGHDLKRLIIIFKYNFLDTIIDLRKDAKSERM